jgi:hypothetical protein
MCSALRGAVPIPASPQEHPMPPELDRAFAMFGLAVRAVVYTVLRLIEVVAGLLARRLAR